MSDILDFDSLYDLTQKDPDRTLNLAIILQALLDMSKPKEDNETNETALQRDQASAWVFATVGVTSENFKTTCHLAVLYTDRVRNFAIKAVTSENVNEIRRKLNSFL